MKLIEINPSPAMTVHPITDQDVCVVVDNFLKNPGHLVEFAMDNAAAFEPQAIGYPGVLCDVPRSAMDAIHGFIRSHMSRRFSFFKGDIRTSTYLSMATRQPEELAPLQRLPHSDPRANLERNNYAALVYLFDDAELGGTGFYRWTNRKLIEEATAMEIDRTDSSAEFLAEHLEMYRQPPRYMNGSNEVAELLLEIPARFNRLLFYSGDVPHSAHIPQPERLSADFARGRLTLNCFASVRPK
ncbi:MAG: DUF6445 family protein [Woeseiaceae bacterium]|nr:DUF6445 family protein [Woeseiaceae bacterium]